MDPKRIESSSSISSSHGVEATSQSPAHEYGPFPGEVAYPPVMPYSQPFPVGQQAFPQISSYPQVYTIPWDLMHSSIPYFTDDYSKVDIDVEREAEAGRGSNNQEEDAEARQFGFFGGPFLYPRPFYGFAAPFVYPSPYYYSRPFVYSPFFW